MAIQFACQSCLTVLTAADDKAGRKGKCPKCGAQFVIPAALENSEASGYQTLLSPARPIAQSGSIVPPKPARLPLPQAAVPPTTQPFLLTIGDIGITSDSVVTPNGSGPLAGSQWICTDMSRTESKIPAVAIILAIVFFLVCLIGLLFLLIKSQVTTGYVEVSVRSGDIYHTVQIPINNVNQVAQIRAQVNKAQVMAHAVR
jgi:hypothetical protein